MKTTIKLLALGSLLILWSCSNTKDNTTPSGSTGKVEQVSGDWIVSSYFDSGKDETSNYNGYSFTFSQQGTLSAAAGATSFTGSWRIGDASSDDDNTSNKFFVSITGNKQMDDLAKNWLIISITDTQISLQDDNPSSMETLKFSRKNR